MRLVTIVNGNEELTVEKVPLYELETTITDYRWDFIYSCPDIPEQQFISFYKEKEAFLAIAAWLNIADPQGVEEANQFLNKTNFLPDLLQNSPPAGAMEMQDSFVFPIKVAGVFKKQGGYGFSVRMRDDPYTVFIVKTTMSSLFHAKAAMYSFVRAVNSRLEGKR